MSNNELIEYVENYTYIELQLTMNQALNHYESIEGIDSKYYSQFIPEKAIKQMVPRLAMNYMVSHICTDKHKIQIGVENYIKENYGIDYMKMLLRRSVSDQKIRILILDDFFDVIKTTSPYRQVKDLNFWFNATKRVKTNLELQHYVSRDNLPYFVETYAPDWKEQTN